MCYGATGAIAFFMYLLKLYKQNKWWFAVVLLFAFGQVFINYKNGVMLSPFYNYDMFSYPYLPQRQYEVVQIRVNGKLLQPNHFSPHEWDNIMQPVSFFYRQKDWNSFIFHTEVQKFLPIKDSDLFVSCISEKEFFDWFKPQVLRIAGIHDKNSPVTIRRDSFLLSQQYLFKK